MIQPFVLLLTFSIISCADEHDYKPKECNFNETSDICGNKCEPACHNMRSIYCEQSNCNKDTTGCRCIYGTVRDEITGSCVQAMDCTRCKTGETFDTCEGTCQNPSEPENCSDSEIPRCVCDLRIGYVRNEFGECVQYDQC